MTVTRRGVVTVRARAALLACVAAALLTSCAPAVPAGPAAVEVVLPAGVEPQVLAAAGDALLIGGRSAAGGPAVLRRAADGAVTEIPTRAATPYGQAASWYALTADGPGGSGVLGIGGERGGAHGNVRWSVWTGTATDVAERPQAFSTFGGWGAGDLVAGVFAPAGPVLVGSWQSADAGLDVAVWTADGPDWRRRPSTGTALASTRAAQGFATSAAVCGGGVVVAGWQINGARQTPVVWRSGTGDGGWTRTPLPDAGARGGAVAVSGDAAGCAVAGHVDGRLALWRSSGAGWARVPDLPAVPVGDRDPLPAPVSIDGRLVQLAGDPPGVVGVDDPDVTPLTGVTGRVRAAVAVGGAVYVVADEPARLWRLQP